MAQNESANPGGNRIGAMPSMITTTTRPAARRHSTEARGLMAVPGSPLFEGRFGRMFRGLPVFSQAESHLLALGSAMIPSRRGGHTGGRNRSRGDDQANSGRVHVSRTVHRPRPDVRPGVDARPAERPGRADRLPHAALRPGQRLRSRTGRPALPLRSGARDRRHARTGLFFLLGHPVSQNIIVAGPDLPRNAQGRALIGDPRNDENLIVSQLHSVMLRFHNRMLDKVAAETPLTGSSLMKETQRRVRWHYQWVVIHDFLPRIVGQEMVDEVFPSRRVTVHGPGGGSTR